VHLHTNRTQCTHVPGCLLIQHARFVLHGISQFLVNPCRWGIKSCQEATCTYCVPAHTNTYSAHTCRDVC
jgi:hypothetical protein